MGTSQQKGALRAPVGFGIGASCPSPSSRPCSLVPCVQCCRWRRARRWSCCPRVFVCAVPHSFPPGTRGHPGPGAWHTALSVPRGRAGSRARAAGKLVQVCTNRPARKEQVIWARLLQLQQPDGSCQLSPSKEVIGSPGRGSRLT